MNYKRQNDREKVWYENDQEEFEKRNKKNKYRNE